ncbi:unnamed protein product [Gadus morhua 'NCC']
MQGRGEEKKLKEDKCGTLCLSSRRGNRSWFERTDYCGGELSQTSPLVVQSGVDACLEEGGVAGLLVLCGGPAVVGGA